MQELSDLLCIRYSPSSPVAYGLRRLKIYSKCVPAPFRRDWTRAERRRIKELLQLLLLNEDIFTKYYTFMTYSRVSNCLD